MGLLLVPYAFAQGPPQGPGYGNQGYPDQGATETKPMLIRAMRSRPTWGHLRRALTATTPITRTPVHRTATMDQAGSQADLYWRRAVGLWPWLARLFGDAASMAALALADAATMAAGAPSPGVGDSALESVTVIPDGFQRR